MVRANAARAIRTTRSRDARPARCRSMSCATNLRGRARLLPHRPRAPGECGRIGSSTLQLVREFLAELDILPNTYTLENGSGLSLNNRLSPAQIVTLLTYMYENFEVRAEYLASLAIAGVDGTLQRRLRDTQAERRLRAKTGAIRKVSCLSGYAASKDNEVFAFSILINGYKSGGHAIQNIQNQIGLLLTEFYRPTYNARNMKSDEGYDRNRRRAFR